MEESLNSVYLNGQELEMFVDQQRNYNTKQNTIRFKELGARSVRQYRKIGIRPFIRTFFSVK